MKRMPKIKPESGMTLIELLIAIAISGIILAGVTQILTASTASYSLQEEMAVVQQNVRMAKMFLERDSRMAGSGLRNMQLYPVAFKNAAGDDGTDILVISYVDSDPACGDLLPQLTLSGTMPPDSSVAEVKENLGVSPYDAWNKKFVCNGKTYGSDTPFVPFKVVITSPDGQMSDIVTVTQTPSNNKLQNRPYLDFDNKILNTYPPGSTINYLSDNSLIEIEYSYRFKKPKNDGTLEPCTKDESKINIYCKGTLMQKVTTKESPASSTENPIADNLEDLQFAIGLDTDDDGIVDDDEWVNSHDVVDEDEKKWVRLVRINVLGRTSRQHSTQKNTRPVKIEDHDVGAIQDKYGRQLSQVIVMPRNLKGN